MAKYLAKHNQNICCVGDDVSQYIVGGAEIKILSIENVYENTKIIRLEKNYIYSK